MYLLQIDIENVRSIQKLSWRVSAEEAPGWHVILGVNGSGKSTLMRMVALTLVGPTEGPAARPDFNSMLRQGTEKGACNLVLSAGDEDQFSGGGNTPKGSLKAALELVKNGGVKPRVPAGLKPNPERHVWGEKPGWFSASFGPFRRFSGGNREYDKLFYQYPKLARHLTIFGEDVALTEAQAWLKEQFTQLLARKNRGDASWQSVAALLDGLRHMINHGGFLPHDVRFEEVTEDGAVFIDGNGHRIPVEELSDGYRSLLSLTFELVRQLRACYPDVPLFDPAHPEQVRLPGVVLIDEIDVHLHPSWQQKVGLWFRAHFPQIQFIVSTHSTFVCQAADVGSVWKFEAPGGKGQVRRLSGDELDRLVYGNILDAYSTGLFGEHNTRSDEARVLYRRLADLNLASLERDLSAKERKEQVRLRRIFVTTPDPVGTDD